MYRKTFRAVAIFAVLTATTLVWIYGLVPMSRLDVVAAQETNAKAKPTKKEIVPDP